MKQAAYLALTLATILGTAQAATTPQTLTKGTLKIAMEGTYAPFTYRDDKGQLVGFDVDSDTSVVARIAVQLDDGVTASCRVRAFAEDHTTVGEVSFTPQQGENVVDIRTERRATSVERIGCTTPDQNRPR